jgi:hypothetical protein
MATSPHHHRNYPQDSKFTTTSAWTGSTDYCVIGTIRIGEFGTNNECLNEEYYQRIITVRRPKPVWIVRLSRSGFITRGLGQVC